MEGRWVWCLEFGICFGFGASDFEFARRRRAGLPGRSSGEGRRCGLFSPASPLDVRRGRLRAWGRTKPGAPRRSRTPSLYISGGVPSPLPTLAPRVARDSLLSPLPRRGGTPSPPPPFNPHSSPKVCCADGQGRVCFVMLPRPSSTYPTGYASGVLGRKPCIHDLLRRLATTPARNADWAGAVDCVGAGVQKGPGREVVRPGGVEPPAFWSVARRSVQLSYGRTAKLGSANGI